MDLMDKFEPLGARTNKLHHLPPAVVELRDRIIEKFKDEPLSEIAEFVQQVLATEENEVNRLAALAARVYIIRHYVNQFSSSEAVNHALDLDPATPSSDPDLAPFEIENPTDGVPLPGMRRVRIVEDSTVHKVLFPAGVTVDVTKADAMRLTDVSKAVYISLETGEPLGPDEDPEAQYSDEAENSDAALETEAAEVMDTIEAIDAVEEEKAEDTKAEDTKADNKKAKEIKADAGDELDGQDIDAEEAPEIADEPVAMTKAEAKEAAEAAKEKAQYDEALAQIAKLGEFDETDETDG
jgi:hypothetical protein